MAAATVLAPLPFALRSQLAGAATVGTVTLSGDASTASVGGKLFARSGAKLTLTISTSSDTQCVELSGAFTARQVNAAGASSWTFSNLTAGTGDGDQTISILGSEGAAGNSNNCQTANGNKITPFRTSASFVLDNTGPTVTGAVSPAPNAAQWNNSNVSITWSATDIGGSGVASGPTPATESVTATTGAAGVTRIAIATDRVGNTRPGSVTVKLDKDAPAITGSRTPAANADGWSNTNVVVAFSCSDTPSGIKSCPSAATLTGSAANQSVTGTAVDNADNSDTTTVSGINIDKVAPALSGAPTTPPGAGGWYTGDVAVRWTASDALSGLAGAAPADTVLTTEGIGLVAVASVSDKAGNSTNATSSPAVRIDRTAPSTNASAPTAWNNTDVTVALSASDNLSGVAATYWRLDGGPQQTGTSVGVTAEGVHTLEFWSVDGAGNTEPTRSVDIKIDKTPPTITHTQAPAANARGWNNGDVTVTFTCGDTLLGGTASGVASCTPPKTVTTEGQAQAVPGTATDNAGNTATDPATVSIDKTAPTIAGALDRSPNANGWFKAAVTVTFTCNDGLSGVFACTAPVNVTAEGTTTVNGTAIDAADNQTTNGVGPIRIDTTAPSLTGSASAGWHTEDVDVTWACDDELSGIDGTCPAPSTVTGEGADRSASATVTDKAGNQTLATVEGIKIDRTAPTTQVVVPASLPNGWHIGPFEVALEAQDALSGIATTWYSIGSGPAVPYDGPFTFSTPGKSTITFWSVDVAGNVEQSGTPVDLWIDDVAPSIAGSRSPAANAFGWNNGKVTVTFDCQDAESGIASCVGGQDVVNEGAAQQVTGDATDNAGNTASATVADVSIDLTAPSLVGAATTAPNAFGWYRSDVTVAWTPEDALSGIDPATAPADSVVSGEGTNLAAGPVSVSDKAGNSTSASVTGLKIDRTRPAITGRTVNDDGSDRSANANGWFNSAVRVRFSCTDGLSGVQECAGDALVDVDGAHQSVTGNATDKADNGASAMVSDIDVDTKAPATTADVQCIGTNGFCRGDVTLQLAATDQPGLSGVASISYRIGNGAIITVAGASVNVNVPLSGSGEAKVEYFATDRAGNAESAVPAVVKYDTIAPTVTASASPAANALGWNRSDVTVHFDAVDDLGGSTIDPTSITPDVVVSTETAGTVVTGEAKDMAGNTGSDSLTVMLDETAPTLTATKPAPPPSGWYTGPVTVTFACSDELSGVAVCPSPQIVSTQGAGQTATATVEDRAGNPTSASVNGINIDTTGPTGIDVNVDGGSFVLGAVPTPTCAATDNASGVASCTVTATGGKANGVGTFTYVATAVDVAGNSSTRTGTYKVIYRFDGFLQPINDTAHQVGVATSIFKGGSTVPAKLQLKRADGAAVQANTLPTWTTPLRGVATALAIDESIFSEPATSGGTYKWDATAQQYLYNWSTKGSTTGYYYRVGVTLDDGQTYYVSIGLR